MSTPISSLMQGEVLAAHIDDCMALVQQLLHRAQHSWVPVKDDAGTVVGAISATDVLHFQAQERDAQTVKAWQWCHYRPLTVAPDTSVAEVARLMLEQRVHHAVVVDQGRLQGVVSTLDLLSLIAGPAAGN